MRPFAQGSGAAQRSLPQQLAASSDQAYQSVTSARYYASENFHTHAVHRENADRILQLAEGYRKELAMTWLGRELPQWSKKCGLRVDIGQQAGGATTFTFGDGRVLSRDCHIYGSWGALTTDCLPHEVMHMVLADYFNEQIPRWVDEGIAMTTETDATQRNTYGRVLQVSLRNGRAFPLDQLFAYREYPTDRIGEFYSQGWSITRYLLTMGSRQKLLAFVRSGMRNGWPSAAKEHYGFASLAAMQQDWLASLRSAPMTVPKTQPQSVSAQPNPNPTPAPSRVTVQSDMQIILAKLASIEERLSRLEAKK